MTGRAARQPTLSPPEKRVSRSDAVLSGGGRLQGRGGHDVIDTGQMGVFGSVIGRAETAAGRESPPRGGYPAPWVRFYQSLVHVDPQPLAALLSLRVWPVSCVLAMFSSTMSL